MKTFQIDTGEKQSKQATWVLLVLGTVFLGADFVGRLLEKNVYIQKNKKEMLKLWEQLLLWSSIQNRPSEYINKKHEVV